MGNNKNPYFNESGYPDPTAYHAMKPIIKEENNLNKKVNNLVNVLKFIVDLAGFEFIDIMQIKCKKTGKGFKCNFKNSKVK